MGCGVLQKCSEIDNFFGLFDYSSAWSVKWEIHSKYMTGVMISSILMFLSGRLVWMVRWMCSYSFSECNEGRTETQTIFSRVQYETKGKFPSFYCKDMFVFYVCTKSLFCMPKVFLKKWEESKRCKSKMIFP
jgi:hypothetical protein